MTASDTLDRSTANGKRSKSKNGGHGHESCPTEIGLYDPSLFLAPKIGKHGRIEKDSGPPKLLSTHHVAERAAMRGEKQPRKRRGQRESAVNGQPPSLQLLKELKRQRRARKQQTNVQRYFHPSRWTEVEREERKPLWTQHRVHPETPPSPLILPPEGRKEEEEEVPGCGTSKEVLAQAAAPGAGGTEPEGHDLLRSLYVLCLAKSSHCAEDQPTQKSQVMSRMHIFPLHLAQVGWGSLSNEDRNAPHFWPSPQDKYVILLT